MERSAARSTLTRSLAGTDLVRSIAEVGLFGDKQRSASPHEISPRVCCVSRIHYSVIGVRPGRPISMP